MHRARGGFLIRPRRISRRAHPVYNARFSVCAALLAWVCASGCIAASYRVSLGPVVDTRGRAGLMITTGGSLGAAFESRHAVTATGEVGTGPWFAGGSGNGGTLGIFSPMGGVDYNLLRAGEDGRFGFRAGVRARWFWTFDDEGWRSKEWGPGVAFAFLYHLLAPTATFAEDRLSMGTLMKNVSLGMDVQAHLILGRGEAKDHGWFFFGPTFDLTIANASD